MVKLRRYGCPYKGSKSKIVDKLVEAIPYVGVDNFYDLFAGGCAVTHKMLLERRYKTVYANDLNGLGVRLFCDALNGKYHNERRWISRDDFFASKGTDPYITICWSFGNNCRDYLYSKEIEPYKKACHYAVVLDDFTLLRELCPEVSGVCEESLSGITDIYQRRIKFGPTIVSWLKKKGTVELINSNPLYASCHVKKDTKTRSKGTNRDLERLQRLERLQSLQSLESLQRLQSLESLQRLERLQSLQSLERLQSLQRLERLQTSIKDYKEIEVAPNSVIYCDIPYLGSDGYGKTKGKSCFDHESFYNWCCLQKELVLVSEYFMPSDRFTCVWWTKHVQSLCSTKTTSRIEMLYVPTRQLQLYKDMMSRDCSGLKQLELFTI